MLAQPSGKKRSIGRFEILNCQHASNPAPFRYVLALVFVHVNVRLRIVSVNENVNKSVVGLGLIPGKG
jgi:hypothetical protein